MADDILGLILPYFYLTPFIGGFLADRVLGYVKSIYLGGILMAAGYIGMGVFKDFTTFLYFFRINYCGKWFSLSLLFLHF